MSRFAASTPQIKNFMASTPGYDALGNLLQGARSQERAYGTAEAAKTNAAGLDAMAKVKTAKYQGKATIAQARAGAAATQAQGFSNMMGSIASGIGNMDFGGPSAPTTNYSWDAPASQYAPGAISSPGWTWENSGITRTGAFAG